MNENLGFLKVPPNDSEKASFNVEVSKRPENLQEALPVVREELLRRMGEIEMSEAIKRPTTVAAELDSMMRIYSELNTSGELYYQIEAAAEMLAIIERALEYQKELEKYPQAAAQLV